ncbi:MAG: hypothetical protein ACYDB1_04320 [Acidiferrobacteraceae bacterium]
MKDIELYGRLKALGMPPARAWRLTAQIRDDLHPVAAVAAAKLRGAGGRVPRGTSFSGLAGTTGAGIQYAQMASKVGGVASGAIASGFGIASGAAAGSVVPIVGTVIGAALGFVVGKFFGPAKLGQASVTWNDMVAHGYLQTTRGAGFDERYFAEAMKGVMDEGNDIWGGCGPDRHKNPDCFFGPLAQVIRAAYVSGAVPVTATTQQVWQSVVLPWLASGANGLVNWQVLTHQPGQPAGNTLQMLLIEAATDRYINGLPITRADMPEYQGQGYTDHEPAINSVLAQAPAVPTMSSAVATQPNAMVSTPVVASGSALAQAVAPSYTGGAAAPQSGVSASLLSQLLAQQGIGMSSPAAQQVVGQVASQGVTQTAYGPPAGSGSGLPSWVVPAGIAGVVAVKVIGAHKALS